MNKNPIPDWIMVYPDYKDARHDADVLKNRGYRVRTTTRDVKAFNSRILVHVVAGWKQGDGRDARRSIGSR